MTVSAPVVGSERILAAPTTALSSGGETQKDDSDSTEEAIIAFPTEKELNTLITDTLCQTRRRLAESRRRKIRENLRKASARNYSDSEDELDLSTLARGGAEVVSRALDEIQGRPETVIRMNRVRCPPGGLAWVRLHCNMKVTENYEHDFHVPYLGESDERINSSNMLAKDLIEAEDAEEGNDSEFDDGTFDDDDSDLHADTVEGPQKNSDTRMLRQRATPAKAPAKVYRCQRLKASVPIWDRAAKRVALKSVMSSMQLSGVDPIADVVLKVFKLRHKEMVDAYHTNIESRLKLWQAKDDDAQRVKVQNAEVLKHAQGKMTTTASDVLKSYSIPYFICRQCYTYCCIMHGTQAPRLLEEPTDKTRKDEGPKQRVELIEAQCEDVRHGNCWISPAIKDDLDFDWVLRLEANTEIWKDVKAVLQDLIPSFGHDPCRVSSMLRVVLPKIHEDMHFTCLRVGSIFEQHFTNEIAERSAAKNNRTPRRKRASVGKKSAKGKTRPPQQESDSMKGGLRLDYYPCHHEGPCTKKVCTCVQNNVLCEKYCGCNRTRALNDKTQLTCNHAFAGCQCKSSCNSNACICFSQGRECDPDRCRTCLDCKHDSDGKEIRWNCRNIGLRMNRRSRTLAGHSDVHGWGVFAATDIAKNEIVGEYVGEVIEQQDAERRGRIYDEVKFSFLFNITQSLALDSTRLGNKLRYCNHSQQPNCEPRVMRVGGDVRVGIYAKRDIARHEELFFNYGYKTDVPYDWAQADNEMRVSKKKAVNGVQGGLDFDDEDAGEVLPVSSRSNGERFVIQNKASPSWASGCELPEMLTPQRERSSEPELIVDVEKGHSKQKSNQEVVVERSAWRGVLKRVTVGAADVESPRRRSLNSNTPESMKNGLFGSSKTHAGESPVDGMRANVSRRLDAEKTSKKARINGIRRPPSPRESPSSGLKKQRSLGDGSNVMRVNGAMLNAASVNNGSSAAPTVRTYQERMGNGSKGTLENRYNGIDNVTNHRRVATGEPVSSFSREDLPSRGGVASRHDRTFRPGQTPDSISVPHEGVLGRERQETSDTTGRKRKFSEVEILPQGHPRSPLPHEGSAMKKPRSVVDARAKAPHTYWSGPDRGTSQASHFILGCAVGGGTEQRSVGNEQMPATNASIKLREGNFRGDRDRGKTGCQKEETTSEERSGPVVNTGDADSNKDVIVVSSDDDNAEWSRSYESERARLVDG